MTKIDEMISPAAGRREFLTRLGSAGLGVAAGTILAGCGGGGNNSGSAQAQSGISDTQILSAAATAEALAVTMYYNIIQSSLYTTSLSGNTPDQDYLLAAYQQEVAHYNFLTSVPGVAPLATTFYFPTGMFMSGQNQTTLNTLEALEDAFIAAYIYGVNFLSSNALKTYAAQIMGVECEHRALARVIANDVGLSGVTQFSGATEATGTGHASNNVAYERTYGIAESGATAGYNTLTGTSGLAHFLTSGATGFSTTPYTYAAATATPPPAVTLDSSAPGQ